MAKITDRKEHYGAKQLIVAVNYEPDTETPANADSVVAAAYPSAAGYSFVQTTINEISACPHLWWILWALEYVRSVTERTNADGTITRVYTVTEP